MKSGCSMEPAAYQRVVMRGSGSLKIFPDNPAGDCE